MTILRGDCLALLAEMAAASVDLVYLDPPFNTGAIHRGKPGTPSEAAAFADVWRETGPPVSTGDAATDALLAALRPFVGAGGVAYLAMLQPRLAEMRRVLKPTGSLYVHSDPTMSHGVKFLLDALFGRGRFENEIVWHYYNKVGRGTRRFARNFDQIFLYSRTAAYTFHPQKEKRATPVRQLVRTNVAGRLANRRDAEGRIMYRTATHRKVDAVWRLPCVQPRSRDYQGYPTEKPVALLERIVRAGSNEGDLVLDPMCGSGTALVAAERLGRRWIGMDASGEAVAVARRRLAVETEGKLRRPGDRR